jgi:hypothetical protein
MEKASISAAVTKVQPTEVKLLEHHWFEAINQPFLGSKRKLVKGWIELEQMSTVFGPTSCGKTFWAMDLALHVASGREWFGCKVAQGGVIYVAAEAGRLINNRVLAFKIHHGLTNVVLPFVTIPEPVNLYPQGKKRFADDLARLGLTIKEVAARMTVKPSLIVIDTLNRAFPGGDENNSEAMGKVLEVTAMLRDKFNCHVMVVHHTGKDPTRKARGHSSLICAVDTAIEVAREADSDVSTVTIDKQRDGIAGVSQAFTLKSIGLGRDEDDDPVTSCVVEWTDAPEKKLTGQNATALKVLETVIEARGLTDLDGRVTVKVEEWRAACAVAFKTEAGSNRERVTWKRIWDAYKAGGGRVGVSGDGFYVWFKAKEEIANDRRPM